MSDLTVVGWIVLGLINLATLYYTRLLEKNTNSKMDKVIALTAQLGEAKGREDQRQETQGQAIGERNE